MGDQMIPILKDTKDPHYRYKMPKLTAKVEGSGNGIKTVITNMVAIAKALGRPPSYPTKYFGCEIGAQVTMHNDYYVVNGSHDPDKLLGLLYGFIRKFVLCTKCNNPETILSVLNQNIKQRCIACGHEATIPKPIHKLTTFIINHPPDGSNPKASKVEKKSKKGGDKNGNDHSHSKDTLDVGNDSNGNENNDDDDFDDEDFTTTAYIERMRDLTEGLKSGIYSSDAKESANMFYNLVKEKKDANLLLDANVQKELVREAERLDIKDKSVLILSELLFTENIMEEIETYRMLLLRFCNENRKAQKYLLGGYEKLVGDVLKDKLFNNSLKILKQFYDKDIIDEETILEWGAKESKKYVSKEMSKKIREKIAPFLKWLKEAEVEDDDDDENNHDAEDNVDVKPKGNGPVTKSSVSNGNEDDDDDEDDDLLEFSHRVSGLQIKSVAPASVPQPVNAEVIKDSHEGEDDIDIDNI